MDGLLEAATALSVCKLACSLLFLPSPAAGFSPVSFCSCCLLIFTDFLLTVFLSFLCVFQSWLLVPLPDEVALRFLLFLSHTYGAVLLLTTPLLAVETLVRLLWCHAASVPRPASRLLSCQVVKVEEEEEEEEGEDRKLFHVAGYFCCLSLWVFVAFHVRLRCRLEEVFLLACLHANGSLLRCLPKMRNPIPTIPSVGPPCWGLAFLLIFLIFLLLVLMTTTLDGRPQAPDGEIRQVLASEPDGRWQKTESGCGAHGLQMSARLHGDPALASPACLSGEKRRWEQERTMRGTLTLIREEEVNSPRRCWRRRPFRAFPCPQLDVAIGLVSVLSIFVLPLYLSVNILVIWTLEAVLEGCIVSMASPSAHGGDATPSHNATLV